MKTEITFIVSRISWTINSDFDAFLIHCDLQLKFYYKFLASTFKEMKSPEPGNCVL